MAASQDHNILNGEGQEGQGGDFTGDAGEVAFAFPTAIEESSNNLGQLLTVLEFRDEAVPGVTDTLAATQGAGGEALEDEDEDMVYEDSHFVPLVGGLLLHLQFLTKIYVVGPAMEAVALSPESEKERMQRLDRELLSK